MADAAKVFLAADLGASSGRVVAGLFDGSKLALEEVYRFDNGGMQVAGRMQWDLLNQWSHVQRGLRAGGKLYGGQVGSGGVGTGGGDFGLVGRGGGTVRRSYHYRGSRNPSILLKDVYILAPEEILPPN